jgi:hypothetical protein
MPLPICRDGFLALAETCFKFGISFWNYLGAQLEVPGYQPTAPLAELILARAHAP